MISVQSNELGERLVELLQVAGSATVGHLCHAFAPEATRAEIERTLDSLLDTGQVGFSPAKGVYYPKRQKPRAAHDFSHLFEPPPGKIAVLSDQTDEMKIGSLYVIRFGKATAGTVCATYASFAAPDSFGPDGEPQMVDCFWQIGDRVLYGPNAGMEFSMDVDGARRTFRIMGEKEILTRVMQPTGEKPVEVE